MGRKFISCFAAVELVRCIAQRHGIGASGIVAAGPLSSSLMASMNQTLHTQRQLEIEI